MSTKRIERLFEVFRMAVAIAIAFLIAFVVLFFVSDDPGSAIRSFLIGPTQTLRRIGNVIELMTPIMFTALGFSIMYSANQFNMSMEGIFYVGGAMMTWIALNVGDLPKVIFPAFLFIAAGIIGAAIAFIPAILKIRFKANEVVSSIMLNYVLLYLGRYILLNHMKDPKMTYNASFAFPLNAKLTRLIDGTRIHSGLIVALAMIVIGYIFLYKTRWGYAIRMCGQNQSFALYSGINVTAMIVLAQLIGGFCAGMGTTSELLGLYNRFQWDDFIGYGWDGLIVSTLARRNPIAIPFASLFLAYLRIGADVVNRSTDVPTEFISIIQAIVIILVAAEMFMSGFKHKLIVRNSRRLEAEAAVASAEQEGK